MTNYFILFLDHFEMNNNQIILCFLYLLKSTAGVRWVYYAHCAGATIHFHYFLRDLHQQPASMAVLIAAFSLASSHLVLQL